MSENNRHDKPEKDGIDWWEKLEAIVNSSVKGVVGGFVKNAHDRWQEFLRKAQKNVAGFFLLIVGFIFALVGISLIIDHLLQAGSGLGFALIGLLALILGLVIIKK